jgi:hypothetical protein
MHPKTPRIRKLLLLGLVVALAGSFWALLGEGCRACSRSAELVGGLNLGAIGTAYYGLLVVAALTGRYSGSKTASLIGARCVRGGMLIAGGVQLTLVAMLFRNRILCPMCLLTAAGALISASAVLALDRRHLTRSVALLCATAVLTYGGVKILRHYAETADEREAMRAERILLREQALPPRGHARMVVYEWPTCHACQAFRAQVLPAICQEFRGQLTLEERTAWKGMSVPTVIVLGRKNTHLVGYYPTVIVRKAVRLACGVT